MPRKKLPIGIPHSWSDRRSPQGPNLSHYEGYYASVFYSHFAALGLDITCEDITARAAST